MYRPDRLLVLSPHTDDGEIGAGGIIRMLADAGVEIRYVAFSTCEESLPAGYASDTLADECYAATRRLGLSNEEVTLLDFKVRRFPERRQEILEALVQLAKSFGPDLVLVPASFDVHQDHTVIHQEAVRAFKRQTILGYELPWNCIEFRTDLVVELPEHCITAKREAIQCYRSQSFRSYGDGASLARLAELRGSQIGVEFAESFEVVRWVWRMP